MSSTAAIAAMAAAVAANTAAGGTSGATMTITTDGLVAFGAGLLACSIVGAVSGVMYRRQRLSFAEGFFTGAVLAVVVLMAVLMMIAEFY